MIGQTHGGKGAATRPTDKESFDRNFDDIFGEKKPWWEVRDERKQGEEEHGNI